MEPGSEFGWATVIGGPQVFLGADYFKYFLFNDPNWDFRTLNYTSDIALSDRVMSPVIDFIDPDISPFAARGGKLIMYQGWDDPLVNPLNSVKYVNGVVRVIAGPHGRKLGDLEYGHAMRVTQSFLRLFMAPGMGHCGGGPGPNAFGGAFGLPAPQVDPEHDMLSALEQWVEHGIAPERIIATKYVNNVPAQGISMQRPLCPYPQRAVYKGAGSINDAGNFACQTPHPPEGAGR